MEKFGADTIKVYHKPLIPLEWFISESRSHLQGFTQIIVAKSNVKVVGMYFLGPSAGEVMQGCGTAMKKGITFIHVEDTVGVHTTPEEESVTSCVTKSSGKNSAVGGC